MMVCEGVCNPNVRELDAQIPLMASRLCAGTKDKFDVVVPISEALALQLRGLAHTAHAFSRIAYGAPEWTCSVCHHVRR